jgi:hypothetical protein
MLRAGFLGPRNVQQKVQWMNRANRMQSDWLDVMKVADPA